VGVTTKLQHVPISEIFGPVIQGEGPLAGVPTVFVRVAGCDYRCTWCDTPYAVLPELWSRTAERLTAVEIADRVAVLSGNWVTLSGGNPAMYDLTTVVDELHEHGFSVAVETQGSKWMPWLEEVEQLVVSPKPPSSGMDAKAEREFPRFAQRVHELYLDGQWDNTNPPALKVVVFDEADLVFARRVHTTSWPEMLPLYLSVGTDPPTDTTTLADVRRQVCDRYAWLMGRVAEGSDVFDERVLPQLHVLAYGHARGV
jgi:7-carboxy-7-deazaguanine synthase